MSKIKVKRNTEKFAKRYAQFILDRIEYCQRDINTLYDLSNDIYLDTIDGEVTLNEYIQENGYIKAELAKGISSWQPEEWFEGI